MATSAFILESFTFFNKTSEELLRQAEEEGNNLAIYMYDAAKEDLEREEDDVPRSYIEDTVMALIQSPEWIADENGWYLDGFHRDMNVHHHHIGIEKTREGKVYKVFFEYGPCGEAVDWCNVEGLKKAKEKAIEDAIRKACNEEIKL